MKYFVEVGGERVELELDGDEVTIGGERVRVHLADVEGTPVRLVTIGTVQHRVVATRNGTRGCYRLSIGGWRFDVEALDERSRAIRDLSAQHGGPAGPAPILAPMPGLIVRVAAGPGDRVRAGQGIVVMEAMKMENELRATADAIVKAVHAVPGSAVEKGTVLVEFDEAG